MNRDFEIKQPREWGIPEERAAGREKVKTGKYKNRQNEGAKKKTRGHSNSAGK